MELKNKLNIAIAALVGLMLLISTVGIINLINESQPELKRLGRYDYYSEQYEANITEIKFVFEPDEHFLMVGWRVEHTLFHTDDYEMAMIVRGDLVHRGQEVFFERNEKYIITLVIFTERDIDRDLLKIKELELIPTDDYRGYVE
jgi:hypothetical protein